MCMQRSLERARASSVSSQVQKYLRVNKQSDRHRLGMDGSTMELITASKTAPVLLWSLFLQLWGLCACSATHADICHHQEASLFFIVYCKHASLYAWFTGCSFIWILLAKRQGAIKKCLWLKSIGHGTAARTVEKSVWQKVSTLTIKVPSGLQKNLSVKQCWKKYSFFLLKLTYRYRSEQKCHIEFLLK